MIANIVQNIVMLLIFVVCYVIIIAFEDWQAKRPADRKSADRTFKLFMLALLVIISIALVTYILCL